MAAVDAITDGRRLRREQNREAVLDALLGLFRDGIVQPSAAEVADRAGISVRSLFRYFDDVDDLSRAAIERHLAAAQPLMTIDATTADPLPVRVERAVESRLRLWEAVAPSARAARACAIRNPLVAAQLAEMRALFRRQVAALFPARAVPAVDVLLSFETYELLRQDQGLSRPRSAAALSDALQAILGAGA